MKFLVMRDDKIGDLVCTTPLFQALRDHYPSAYIAAFVNDYNAEILENNPHLDKIYLHKKKQKNSFFRFLYFFSLLIKLRKERFDYIIIARSELRRSSLKIALLLKATHIISYTKSHYHFINRFISHPIFYTERGNNHEIEKIFYLLTSLGINVTPHDYKIQLYPNKQLVAKFEDHFKTAPIGVHVSATHVSNRWDETYLIKLIQALWHSYQIPIMLLWSPDDSKKATRIIAKIHKSIMLIPCPTHHVSDLIAAISLTRSIICSDGGAMHIAAGLKKPIVCIFANPSQDKWHPWGVRYIALNAPMLNANNININDILAAHDSLIDIGKEFNETPCDPN